MNNNFIDIFFQGCLNEGQPSKHILHFLKRKCHLYKDNFKVRSKNCTFLCSLHFFTKLQFSETENKQTQKRRILKLRLICMVLKEIIFIMQKNFCFDSSTSG